MAKKSNVTLLSPPRYPRNDPRNQARVEAGRLLSMKLVGYDHPIRRLRRVGDVRCVTLPPQARDSLALERGDRLIFGEGPWPGTAWISRVTEEGYQALTLDESQKFRQKSRMVQGKKHGVWIVVPKAFRKRLSAEVGDYLIFGLASQPGVITIAAIKGGGDSAGSRRTG